MGRPTFREILHHFIFELSDDVTLRSRLQFGVSSQTPLVLGRYLARIILKTDYRVLARKTRRISRLTVPVFSKRYALRVVDIDLQKVET